MKTKIAGLALGMALSALAAWADLGDVRFSGGAYDGWDRCVMTNDVGLGSLQVSLSSGTDQVLDWTQEGPALATLTITATDPLDTIVSGVTMHISVPVTWGCRFDTGAAVTCGGSAQANVGTPSYSSDGQMLLIPVTTDFTTGETLTLSGLKVVDLQLASSEAIRFELDFTGDEVGDVYDLYTVQVRVLWPGGSYDGWDQQTTDTYKSLEPPGGVMLIVR